MDKDIRQYLERIPKPISETPDGFGDGYFSELDLKYIKYQIKDFYHNARVLDREIKYELEDALSRLTYLEGILKWNPIYTITKAEESRAIQLDDCWESGVSLDTFTIREGKINILGNGNRGSRFPTTLVELMNDSGYTHWRYRVE